FGAVNQSTVLHCDRVVVPLDNDLLWGRVLEDVPLALRSWHERYEHGVATRWPDPERRTRGAPRIPFVGNDHAALRSERLHEHAYPPEWLGMITWYPTLA